MRNHYDFTNAKRGAVLPTQIYAVIEQDYAEVLWIWGFHSRRAASAFIERCKRYEERNPFPPVPSVVRSDEAENERRMRAMRREIARWCKAHPAGKRASYSLSSNLYVQVVEMQ